VASLRSPQARGQAAGATVEIIGVTKVFHRGGQDTLAVEAVDLTVAPGEFLCLLGPSGCGKSTLLGIVAGFIPPESGMVRVGGVPIHAPGADRGMLFQSPTLFPWLTTRDNVLFGPRAQGLADATARERTEELLDLVGLSGFADHYPHQLSGGMQHRAALARALINRPSVLLMDEPFAALDAILRESMQAFLLELWEREQTTILFVTHDVDEATLLADRVAVMSPRPGRIVGIMPIDLPRPRKPETKDTEEFLRLRRSVRQRLERVLK